MKCSVGLEEKGADKVCAFSSDPFETFISDNDLILIYFSSRRYGIPPRSMDNRSPAGASAIIYLVLDERGTS